LPERLVKYVIFSYLLRTLRATYTLTDGIGILARLTLNNIDNNQAAGWSLLRRISQDDEDGFLNFAKTDPRVALELL